MLERLALVGYALALRAFPHRHLDRYGEEMVEVFERKLSDLLARRGAWRALGFAVAACWDAIAAGLGERRRGTQGHSRTGGWLLGLGQDFSHAVRGLAKSWMYSFVCLFSLAVGLGVTLAIVLLLRQTMNPPFDIEKDGLVESQVAFYAYSALDLLAGAPMVTAMLTVCFAATTSLAGWVLYRNLLTTHTVNVNNATASI